MTKTKAIIPPAIDAVAEYSAIPGKKMNDSNYPKWVGVLFWLSLSVSLLSLFIFWVTRTAFTATLMWIVMVFVWMLWAFGIICLVVGIGLGGWFLFASWRYKKRSRLILKGLALLCTYGLSIHYLLKVIMIIFFSATQAGIVVGAMALYTPQGLAVVSLVGSLDSYIKDQMANSTQPEWRTIHIHYIGSDLPDAPGKASFWLTNMGPHTITSIEGQFHAWTLFHIQKKVSMKFSVPLEPKKSARLDLPLDDFGGEVKDIIEGKNKDVAATLDNAIYHTEQWVDDDVARVIKSSGPYKPNKNAKPEIDYHLRFQLQKMTTDDGKKYFAWFGKLEIGNKNLFFEMMRDFTSHEWKMIEVDYPDEENTEDSKAAVFTLTNTGKLTISSMKGKFHVMDIAEGHVEKTVELKPEKPLAPGESMTFILPAGSESELARQIISGGRKYDLASGNQEQTSYLTRFQLQELYTSDGRKIWIWFGDLNGDIKPEEK